MRHTHPVAPYGLRVTFTDALKEFHALAPGYDGRGACGACAPGKRVDFVVGVFDRRWQTLVHECTHVAVLLLEKVGIDPLSNNAEPLAYMVDHLTSSGAARLKIR
ncbi:hypothetical protein BCR16_12760 [Ralstonia solanacearum FJAT-1458]|nr:hypothetical protein BCR16_12760 [Ralstonia solanacearum FJAT-1458]